MNFPERLTNARKEKGLTQQQVADLVGVHVVQIRRYESSTCQPTLDIIAKLALALNVSADMLIFGQDEKGPDKELYFHFTAISKFSPEEKKIAKSVIEALILQHQAKVLATLPTN